MFIKSSVRDFIVRISPAVIAWFFRHSYKLELVSLFVVSMLAAIIPVFFLGIHFEWLWVWVGATSICIAYTTALRGSGAADSAHTYVRCVALLGIAMVVDFWRISPDIILSVCRSPGRQPLVSVVMQHIDTHFRFFPVASLAMLVIVFLNKSEQLMATESRQRISIVRRLMQNHLVQGVVGFFCMSGLMGVTMDIMLKLAARLSLAMDGAGIVSAMICGMAAYHVMVNGWNRIFLRGAPTVHW